MSNLAKYGEWGAEDAKKEQKKLEEESSAGFVKLKVGRNILRFLPPKSGQRSPFKVVYQHFIKLPGQSNPLTFACPRMESRRFCPACHKADKLRATGNPVDYDLAGKFLAKRRVFANVIDRNNEDAGPQILGFGKQIHEQLLALRTDKDAGGNYTHPESGFDIIISRTGTQMHDTKYSVKPARDDSPLGDLAWLDVMHDLERFAKVPSQEDIENMVQGIPSGGGGGDDTSHGNGSRRRRTIEADMTEED